MINGQLFGILNAKADELYRIQFNTPTELDEMSPSRRGKQLLQDEEELENQQLMCVCFFASGTV